MQINGVLKDDLIIVALDGRSNRSCSGTVTTAYFGGRIFELVSLSSSAVRFNHYIGDFAGVKAIAVVSSQL